MSVTPQTQAPQAPDADDGQLINFQALRNWVLFSIRALQRRKWLAVGVSATVIGLAALALAVMPKTYQAECKLLAQTNKVLSTRSDAQNPTDPARAAAETVLARENVVALVKQTGLVKAWWAHRAPISRLKDSLVRSFGTMPDDAEMTVRLAETVETQMKVWTNEGGTVTIKLTWPDGEMAYRLVEAAQRSFLEARHVQEVSTFAESASILEGHAAGLAREVDAAIAELQRLRQKKHPGATDTSGADAGAPRPAPASAPAPAAAPAASAAVAGDPAAAENGRRAAEIGVLIEAKRRVLDELEGFRQRRLSELQAKLEEQRATYTDAHPAIADLKQSIQAASTESAQVGKLRAEMAQLQTEAERLGAPTEKRPTAVRPATGGSGSFGSMTRRDAAFAELAREEDRDPETEYAKSKLKFAIENYQAMQEQIRLTRLDLETAQAAFKYRYVTVSPPQRPRGPISPKPLLILGAGVLCALLLSVIGAVAFELREGMIHEAWQIEHTFGMEVLAESRVPALPPKGGT